MLISRVETLEAFGSFFLCFAQPKSFFRLFYFNKNMTNINVYTISLLLLFLLFILCSIRESVSVGEICLCRFYYVRRDSYRDGKSDTIVHI